MANTKSSTISSADTTDREVVIRRLINAPRELVFDAWTDPEHVGEWYGPTGFTITTHEIDIRPGGVWRFIMHGPDGIDYPNYIKYDEVVKPERLAYSHGSSADEPDLFYATITFEEANGKTQLQMKSVFKTKEERDYVVREHKAIEGGNQTVDRFEAYLRSR
ncbi:MAG TPA: SRPBCC family protein [Chitinophagaceae bacterium]|nr:SRPBCC family protein [Chitinophagaceae bacterium]